jgi:CIC family chloride channel protein
MIGGILLDDIRSVFFNQSLYDLTKAREYTTRPPEVIDYAKDNMQQVMQRFQDSGAWNLPVIREVSIMVLFRNRNF